MAIRIFPDADAASGEEIPQADGSTVYRGRDSDVATVVDPTAHGAQIATVSFNSGDTDSFSYRLDLPDGAQMSTNDDGGADILTAEGLPLAAIDAPWALDADGTPLPTAYTISGNTIIQTVDMTDAVLPVVADPKLETHWYWAGGNKLWFTRRETEVIYRYQSAGAGLAASAAALCALIPSKPLAWVCGASIASKLADFSVNLKQAHVRNHCLTLFTRPSPPFYINFEDGDDRQYCVHP